MTEDITIKRALISVYDKTDVVQLAQLLHKNGVEIISTGKTHQMLLEAGIKAIEVAEYTKSPEIMGGRVKTLHPKIHGGILGIRGLHDFSDNPPIDLVVANLYPFVETTKKEDISAEEIIENIDIGGVTLIRAAAKNFHHVCIITNPSDYKLLESTVINFELRKKLAVKAFGNVLEYDHAIHNWFAADSLQEMAFFGGKKSKVFRYGENPHQQASFYTNDFDIFPKQLQGKELSYNNILDVEAAYKLILEFDEPTAAVIKHTNPCGVASDSEIITAYKKALDCDPISSFGGIVIVNREVESELASLITKIFTEVVIAPSVTSDALSIFAQKPNLRILQADFHRNNNGYSVRNAFGGLLIQEEDNDLMKAEQCVTESKPNDIDDLHFAWKICKHVKSNAIVICKDKRILGVGAGQMSRVDSTKIALEKANKNGLHGSVLASDAFFPFDDCIKLAAKAGITSIIQPGGSINDDKVIATANQLGLTMIFTQMRHFKH